MYLSHDRHVIQWNNPFHKKSYDHTYNNTCAASNWLDQLASLLFVLIRLLIATKMASDFATQTVERRVCV